MAGFSTVLAGRGGQGILLSTRVLMEEAMLRGTPVRGSETHGMAQRGGSVVAHVRTGPFHSPIVPPGSAHLLLGLEPFEALRNLAHLRRGGLLLVDAPDRSFLDEATLAWIEAHAVEVATRDATAWVRAAGVPRSANMFIVGMAGAHPATPYRAEALREAVRRSVRPKYPESCLAGLVGGLEVDWEVP
jgi:indolepyruvate ferredoxin oxidoreductase beta subunit